MCRLLLLFVVIGAVAAQTYPRHVTKELSVLNGAETGTWRREEFCPKGTYASGFKLKVYLDNLE